jgi:hypothetical protein
MGNIAEEKISYGEQQRKIDENIYSRKNQKKEEAITCYKKRI